MSTKNLGSSNGLTIIDDAGTAFVSSEFNSGYMNGDIKLATLSDTDTTDLVGTELVTNGTFDTDTGWAKGTGWSVDAVTNFRAVGTSVSSFGPLLQSDNAFATVIGKTYTVSFDIPTISAGGVRIVLLNAANLPEVYASGDFTTTGTHSYTFSSRYASTIVAVQATAAFTGTIDNISVRLAEEDRSVNGNGLQVFGTVTKTPVALGADLVAYSGFSASNYLEQPYNPDLDFGTGDFCVMGWVKVNNNTNYRMLAARLDQNSSVGWNLSVATDNTIYLYTINGGVTAFSPTSGNPAPQDTWVYVCAIRKVTGVIEFYYNGVLQSSESGTSVNVNTGEGTYFGYSPFSSQPANLGSLALLRISATAPTEEQIKKIYEDEKVLFQEGSSCVLYGDSDAVTALAYDDSTELLHVGTSAGRSDFKGLRRVSNTTDAVGSAISASNGLIAED